MIFHKLRAELTPKFFFSALIGISALGRVYEARYQAVILYIHASNSDFTFTV